MFFYIDVPTSLFSNVQNGIGTTMFCLSILLCLVGALDVKFSFDVQLKLFPYQLIVEQ